MGTSFHLPSTKHFLGICYVGSAGTRASAVVVEGTYKKIASTQSDEHGWGLWVVQELGSPDRRPDSPSQDET